MPPGRNNPPCEGYCCILYVHGDFLHNGTFRTQQGCQALEAGIPREVPAFSVQRNCASGFQSITDGYNAIALGEADVIVAGGVESMSNVPLQYPDEFADVMSDLSRARSVGEKVSAATQIRPAHFKPVVALLEGLTDPVCGLNMGQTAEVLARELHLSRRAQDEYALRSHQRASAAWAEGRFAEEVTPVFVPPAYRDVVAEDVGYRPQQTLEALSKLKPVFEREGTVTAGNSSMVTDGAAALLLMEEGRARAEGLRPLGRISSFAYAGLEPERMGLGPALATPLALSRAGVSLSDVGLVELNEAFAAIVLANMEVFPSRAWAEERLGRTLPIGTLREEVLNVNGGAIALGHPIAATGSRLALTLLLEMRRRDVELGLATLCVGGGLGGAIVFQRTAA